MRYPIRIGWRVTLILAVIIALFVAVLVNHVHAQTKADNNSRDARKLAANVSAVVAEVVDAVPNVRQPSAAAVDIPDIVTRVGFNVLQNRYYVVPTQWCKDHQTLCTNTLIDRFWREAQTSPSNNPSPHANDNMKRVYLNSFPANPAKSAVACEALCSYNHYRDDVNNPGGYCQTTWVVTQPHTIGQPAYPSCRKVAWGGPDGSDGGINFDNLDKGFVVCETAILGVAAGEQLIPVPPPIMPAIGLTTIEKGTLGCGITYLVSKFLF